MNEDGRWRKHKCKFHREVQNHLAEVNKYLNVHSKRNCACFTPDGVVYTKIKTEREFFKPKQKRFDRHRHRSHHQHHHRQRSKRSTADDVDDDDEIYIQHLPSEFLELLRLDRAVGDLQSTLLLNQSDGQQGSSSRRSKRETRDYVMQTLDELTTLLGSIERKYANSSTDPVQCSVEPTGMVNCSTNVYESEEAWRQSQTQINMLIKLLKNKITDLKDIKRHLKEHRPLNMTYDEEIYENFSLSAEEIDEHSTKSPKRKFKSTETPSQLDILHSKTTTTTQKQSRNRTKKPTTTTDGISTTVTESTSKALLDSEATTTTNFSFMPELNFDYSTLAAVTDITAIIQSSTTAVEMLATTTASEVIRATLDDVIVDSSTTNSESTTVSSTGEEDKKVPAECFCEPEPNV